MSNVQRAPRNRYSNGSLLERSEGSLADRALSTHRLLLSRAPRIGHRRRREGSTMRQATIRRMSSSDLAREVLTEVRPRGGARRAIVSPAVALAAPFADSLAICARRNERGPMNGTPPRPERTDKYRLVCTACGEAVAESRCPRCPEALLRTEYRAAAFAPTEREGIFRFLDWLPSSDGIETPIGPVVYRSERLADRLDLPDLYIGFNGYAPEVGARNMTGSFKDFEALPTLLHFRDQRKWSIVLASAGNTARAFAYAGAILDFPIYIVVPEAMLQKLWIPVRPTEAIRVIAVSGSRDYAAAIRLASLLSERLDLPAEGGARNVARRDGMGTCVLEFARTTEELPQHYVQAVGSGTGAIAAWEASLRLLRAGGFGASLPALHLVQNAPFTPIHDAWSARTPIRPEADVPGQLERIRSIVGDVLANRNPPYAIPGGVRDALRATSGRTYAVTNEEIAAAQALFSETEGVPISPEAGAAVAALSNAVAGGQIPIDESVLLNVTGNNEALLRRDYALHPLDVSLRVDPREISDRGIDDLAERLRRL